MIKVDINNNQTLEVFQSAITNSIITKQVNSKGIMINEKIITEDDFVMLMNYYSYIKENNVQCDFINPHGTVTR